jgi:hypothetical protein
MNTDKVKSEYVEEKVENGELELVLRRAMTAVRLVLVELGASVISGGREL